MWPGFKFWCRSHMWEFAVSFLLCCERVLSADSGFPIRHLHISHNTPCLPLPKILHNLCFSVLLGVSAVPREIENNAYAKFWGANKVYYGRCANGEFQLDQKSNRRRWLGAGFSLFWVLQIPWLSMTFHDLRFSCHFSSNIFKTLLVLAYFFSFKQFNKTQTLVSTKMRAVRASSLSLLCHL